MSKYVAFLDILGFKEKLKKLKQQDAKSFIGRFSTTAFEQWENMSPTLVEGYIGQAVLTEASCALDGV